jgi:hypothetical protein
MRAWAKRALAVLAGLAASVVLISLVQWLNFTLFPPPDGLDPNDPEHLARIMAQMPVVAFLLVELSYALGSLGGGWVVGRLAPDRPLGLAIALGVLLTVAGGFNLASVPHPVWMAVLTTITYVPMAVLGARVAGRQRKTAREP